MQAVNDLLYTKLDLKPKNCLYKKFADNIKNAQFQCKKQAIELTVCPTEKGHR